tara:strand:+ start:2964 stop:3644 length:681 start_codon:yes stop_codon:yes gene_type:complete
MQKIFSQLSDMLSADIIKFIIVFCVIGVIFSGLFNYILSYYFDFDVESIKQWVNSYDQYAPIAYILLVVLAIVISPIPSTPLGIVAGITFGTFLGTVYSMIGAQIGAFCAFLIARKWGRPAVEKLTSKKNLAQFDQFSDNFGFLTIIIIRFIPTFSFDLVSYCAGLTSMNVLKFNVATFLGMFIPITALVFVGDSLLTNPFLAFVVFGILFIAFLIPVIIMWILKK